jgi:hypothetical protein
MSDITCTICLNNFEDDDQCYILPYCSHKFHTKCIINWFRKGSTCPICRDNTVEDFDEMPAFILRERGIELRKISRKKNAPQELKDKVAKIKKIETAITEHKKKFTEFKKEYQELLKTYTKLNSKTWNLRSKKRKAERNLGIFQSPEYPLPALIIQPTIFEDYP